MEIIFGLFLVPIVILIIYTLVSLMLGDIPFPFLLPLFGYTKIQLYNGQYSFNESFVTYAKWDKEGDLVKPIYRYTDCKVGIVELLNKREAYYCGKYNWKII